MTWEEMVNLWRRAQDVVRPPASTPEEAAMDYQDMITRRAREFGIKSQPSAHDSFLVGVAWQKLYGNKEEVK